MKKFIKEEICKGVYLMCGYSKSGNLYYCIVKDKFKSGNNNDIMFLNRFQFARLLEGFVQRFDVHINDNGSWSSDTYYLDTSLVSDVLDYHFPLVAKDNE